MKLLIRVFQLDAVEHAARSFRSLAKRQEQAGGMFYYPEFAFLKWTLQKYGGDAMKGTAKYMQRRRSLYSDT